MKKAFFSVTIATLFGFLAGGLHLYLRFLNNTQDEMYTASGHVDLPYAALLFFVVFIPIWLAVFTTSFGLLFLAKIAAKRMRNKAG
jgi:H+/Cl- antiporter ClcA